MRCRKATGLFADRTMQEPAERLAEREELPEVLRGEIRPRTCRAAALVADLDNADDGTVRKNWGADNFLNGFRSRRAYFYAFEDNGVACRAEIVVDFRAAFA